MNDAITLAQVQRSMLLRSIYLLVAPVMLLFAVLACGTIVTDTASYICPTGVPQATATTLAGTPPRRRIFTSGMPSLSGSKVRRCVCGFVYKTYRFKLLAHRI